MTVNYYVTGFETDWTKKELMGAVLTEKEALRLLKSGERPVIRCREDKTDRLVASAYTGSKWTLATSKGDRVSVTQAGAKALVSLLFQLDDCEATLTLDDDLELLRANLRFEGWCTVSLLGGKETGYLTKDALRLARAFLLGECLWEDLSRPLGGVL